MTQTRTIVVTGATGNVGGQVVTQLAERGITVRAVGRDRSRIDRIAMGHKVEGHVADLTDPESLRPALEGADGLFLVFPSVAADASAAQLIALASTHVRRVVYLSSAGVQDTPTGDEEGILGSHTLVEGLVRASVLEWTFLRSGGMATNTLGWAESTRAGGTEVRWYGPRLRRPLVHEADLAAVGVLALLEDGHHGHAYHLTGPESVTQEQQVGAIAAALGRPLRFVDIGEEGGVAVFEGWGFPSELAREVVRGQLLGVEAPEQVSSDIPRLLGRAALTYAQWALDHAADFR